MLTTQDFNNLISEPDEQVKKDTFPDIIEGLEMDIYQLEDLKHKEYLRIKELANNPDYGWIIENANFMNFAEMGANKIEAIIKSQKDMIKKLKKEIF